MAKITGIANGFQRDYLEANMKGKNFKGSEVLSVTNKYIHTKNGSYLKAGRNISFEEIEGTRLMIRQGSRR